MRKDVVVKAEVLRGGRCPCQISQVDRFAARRSHRSPTCLEKCCRVASVGLEEKDIVFAQKEWISNHWDISLRGVRKCIAAYIREFIEIAKIKEYKSKGVKTVYGISPSQPVCFRAIKLSAGQKVVLGAFFNKNYLLSQNDTYLSQRCRHCALNCTRINAGLRGVIPEPDVIWSWGFFCDEAPKTEELMSCLTEKRWYYIVSRLPHDCPSGEHEDENRARVAYLAQQYREAHEEIHRLTGIKVTGAEMWAALKEEANYCRKLDELTRIVTNSDPQPIGGNELALFCTFASLTFNTGLHYFAEALYIILEEVKELVEKGKGILPKGSPKLGCHFTPLCVPWVDRAFLQNGVSLSFRHLPGRL